MNELDNTSVKVVSDSNGDYSVTGISAGTYALEVNAQGYAYTVLTGLSVDSGSTAVDVTMTAESVITGTVSPETGAPSRNAAGSGLSQSTTAIRPHLLPEHLGAWISSLMDFPRGLFGMAVELDGYLSETLTNVTATAGQTLALGTISLAPAAEISRDDHIDEPQTLGTQGPPYLPLRTIPAVDTTEADDSGDFTFDDLPPARILSSFLMPRD